MSSPYVAMFPGQGSQKVGMLASAAESNPSIVELFARASEVLGYDLWSLSQQGPQEELNLTETTQPLILTASVAIWEIWKSSGAPAPQFLAGHSLGEFSALVCAGTLAFEDAVALVRNRGRYMQAAVPVGVGAMAAVLGLDDDAIAEACNEAAENEVVEAVNLNAPGQVVIAGHAGAVERAIEKCKARGAKRAMPLPVSAPFHTSLMKPAGEQLAVDLAGVRLAEPAIPVIHNVHAQPEQDPERIRALLTEQIHSPVQWVRSMQFARTQGVQRGVEIGPGKVLSGLCKRIEREFEGFSSEDPADLAKSLEAVGS